ncbi:MAG: adenylate/guanylate cyclase domain-containing protein [Dongiaceae bacterium]
MRRLAAVLAADVVGYSRLIRADETATLTSLREQRAGVIEPSVAAHRGRIVKLLGDGFLAEFGSVVDAVSCAVAIQRAAAEQAGGAGGLPLRIGINIGELVIEDGDIYGDGVNIAARLQEVADPGGIAVSDLVFAEVRNKLEVQFEPLGLQQLKNIDEPVGAHRVRWSGAMPERAAPPARPVLGRPAVAVLPFENLSGDADQGYFADGITEDVITALSCWRWFPVISRNSTFAFKARAAEVSEIARQLGARYIVEGSVRRAGGRIRIGAQLVDAASGHQLWAERYDRQLADMFDLQDEIARAIVSAIEPQIARAEDARVLRKAPHSLDAWDLAVRALWLIRRGTRAELGEARGMLEQAIRLDPAASYPRSLLALALFQEALSGWTSDPPRALAATRAAAAEAVAADDGDWLAHALLGIGLVWTEHAFDRAIAEEERAITLNPSSAIAYQFLGCALGFGGRPEAALKALEAVLRLDPRYQSRSLILADMALCHLLLGANDDAVRTAREAVAEGRRNVRAWQRLAAALGRRGETAEAAVALAQVLTLQPDFSLAYLDATYPFRSPEDRAIMLDGLQRAGWQPE